MRNRRRQDRYAYELELMLFRIEFHGPSAVYDHLDEFMWFAQNYRHGFREIRTALLAAGMDRTEIVDLLFRDKHPLVCACWRCIMRLHSEVVRSAAERSVR